MGQSPPSSTYNSTGDGLPFFQGKADFTSLYPVPSKWCTKPLRKASRNDILISVRAPVGDVNMSPGDCCIGRGLAALSCNSDTTPFFLFFFLLSDKEEIQRHGTGTTFQSINKKVFEKLTISLPPLPEQKKIAAVLLKIQRAIETQEKIIQSLRDLKKSTMHFVFSRGLHGEKTKSTEIGEMPESWGLRKTGDVFKLSSGKTRPADISSLPSGDTPFKVYGGNGVMGYSSESFVEEDVLILGRVGEYCGAVHVSRGKTWISDNALYSREWLAPDVSLLFAAIFLDYFGLNRFRRKSSQPLITQGVVSDLMFPVPSITEQGEIVQIIQTLSQDINVNESKKAALQDLFKTTLNKLMTGKIRVADLDIDESEVEG